MGQVKEVRIHKFVVQDSVELRIQQLQQKKLDLADGVLTGAKRASKLTMDDLKMLFGLDEKKNIPPPMMMAPTNKIQDKDEFKFRPNSAAP